MNQAIQFPDREEWDQDSQQVIFPVMFNGFLMNCVISGKLLAARYGSGEPLILFQQNRWDLEEEFSTIIDEGKDDTESVYSLSDDSAVK